LSNQSIADALLELIGKPAAETIIAFIPTAMNADTSNKVWFINDLLNIKNQGFKFTDIVDISALEENIWLPRIKAADVLFFSGGNSSHLMRWIKESKLDKMLPELLKTKVYAGISAGSIVTNPKLTMSSESKKVYYEETTGYRSESGLGLVEFYVRPHYNSPLFRHARKEYIEEIAKKIKKTVYAIDDQSALKVMDGKVEVVGEGEWLKI